MQPIAVDAMGGDRAPDEIVAGAREAAAEGIPVVVVGPPDRPSDDPAREWGWPTVHDLGHQEIRREM